MGRLEVQTSRIQALTTAQCGRCCMIEALLRPCEARLEGRECNILLRHCGKTLRLATHCSFGDSPQYVRSHRRRVQTSPYKARSSNRRFGQIEHVNCPLSILSVANNGHIAKCTCWRSAPVSPGCLDPCGRETIPPSVAEPAPDNERRQAKPTQAKAT